MNVQSATVRCPTCGHWAQMRLFEHTDEHGHPSRHELELSCSGSHDPPGEGALIALWASVHASTRG